MSELITLCDDCKPIGRMEEIAVGVLIGKCEICGALCPPVELSRYWRREYESVRDMRIMKMYEEISPELRFEFDKLFAHEQTPGPRKR